MIRQAILNLIQYEIDHHIITYRDLTYVKNQIYQMLNLEMEDEDIYVAETIAYPSVALEYILDYAIDQNIIENTQIDKDLFDSKIMNIFADKPSVVEDKFMSIYKDNKREAMLWYYNYAKSLNYIRTDRIDRNKAFLADTPYGKLQITINLSKPEKDPKSIAMQASAIQTSYPKCVLCVENEGFSGNLKRDSRNQHRLLKTKINDEYWYFQYSPYIYYNEHAIVINELHRPMKIGRQTFNNLIELTDIYEGYFFGSNADLPIVGGSILSHDHYQGGYHRFPIEDATSFYNIVKNDVAYQLLNWPLSTIKLLSKDKDKLIHEAEHILNKWIAYDNKALDIIAYTNDIRHHTITPIVSKHDDTYHMYLILRDNHTSDEHPLGVYHPHDDVWHIKKENIGLIEAIGQAILPGRLINELEEVKDFILKQKPLSNKNKKHEAWASDIKKIYDGENIDLFINHQVGLRFARVLSDCGVFKEEKYFIEFLNEALK